MQSNKRDEDSVEPAPNEQLVMRIDPYIPDLISNLHPGEGSLGSFQLPTRVRDEYTYDTEPSNIVQRLQKPFPRSVVRKR